MSIREHVRTSDAAWCRFARTCRGAALTFHLPVAGPTHALFRALYRLHVVARESVAWGLRVFWFEPLFRSQCDAVGPRFRMERLPYITGRGRIVIGSDVRLSGKSGFCFGRGGESPPRVTIGDGTFIGHDCGFFTCRSVDIGRRCLIATRVTIRDNDGHPTHSARRERNEAPTPDTIRPVVIGDDVWIGAGAVVLKGVSIGKGAVIGAGAVVTRDVEPGSIVAGNPARVVRQPDTAPPLRSGVAA